MRLKILKILSILLIALIFNVDAFGTKAKAICNRAPMSVFICRIQYGSDKTYKTNITLLQSSTHVTLSVNHVTQTLTTAFDNGPGPGRPIDNWSSEGINALLKQRKTKVESINKLYLTQNQMRTLSHQCHAVGVLMNTNHFFAKGHLAANGDYTKTSYKKSTFHYFNDAPQWQPFNNGNWKYVEKKVQDLVKDKHNEIFKVYTGTYGHLRCPDSHVPLYIKNGGNVQRRRIPVHIRIPKFFYKIIIAPNQHQGLNQKNIFIGVSNDPIATKSDIERDAGAHLCHNSDICQEIHQDSKYNWFDPNGFRCDKTVQKGYMYMCEATPGFVRRFGIQL